MNDHGRLLINSQLHMLSGGTEADISTSPPPERTKTTGKHH